MAVKIISYAVPFFMNTFRIKQAVLVPGALCFRYSGELVSSVGNAGETVITSYLREYRGFAPTPLLSRVVPEFMRDHSLVRHMTNLSNYL
jgi:hypothetical protein